MHTGIGRFARFGGGVGLAGVLGLAWSAGCGALPTDPSFYLAPFLGVPVGGITTEEGTDTTGGDSGFFGGNNRTNTDPCAEPLARKFVRISMRNLSESHVHYFVAFIAFVNGETHTDGAVCPEDISIYTDFGYTEIPEGSDMAFGVYCIQGPALVYFHRGGQFRGGGAGLQSLASAIPPAQGTNATFDNVFSSAGAQVPAPNAILFHNPGTGEGAALRISRGNTDPCNATVISGGESDCAQDAFYYVDDTDVIDGSSALGSGSGRRTANEVQGTGCQCGSGGAFTLAAQVLAPSGVTGSNARCNEFIRGGRIEYAFIRQDVNPPIPQLLWRVFDASGGTVHEFDSRAQTP